MISIAVMALVLQLAADAYPRPDLLTEPADLLRRPDTVRVLDVRGKNQYDAGHVPGAVSLPHAEIDADALEALGDRLLVVYCWGPGCNAAQHAGARIGALGRQVKEMLGGWEYYVREGWPVEGELVDLYRPDELGLVAVPQPA